MAFDRPHLQIPVDRPQSTGAGSQQPEAAQRPRQRSGLTRREDPGYGMSLFGGGPFSLLRQLDEDMDRLFEAFRTGRIWQGGRASAQGGGTWMPQIEMCEREGKLHVYADLPGMKKEDITLEIDDDRVTIHGERRTESSSEARQGYFRSERSYGSFYRVVPLPEGVDANTADASFRDGVLDISFDVPTQRRGRRLEIKETPAPGAAAGERAQAGASSAGTAANTATSTPAGAATGAAGAQAESTPGPGLGSV